MIKTKKDSVSDIFILDGEEINVTIKSLPDEVVDDLIKEILKPGNHRTKDVEVFGLFLFVSILILLAGLLLGLS